MFDGVLVGRGIAGQSDCPPLPYSMVEPRPTPANDGRFARGIAAWTGTAFQIQARFANGGISPGVVDRAWFAVTVLQTVDLELNLGRCCQLVAGDPDDQPLGAMVYTFVPPAEGVIDLLAVAPRNVPGSPFAPQLRGVGTALVAAAASRLAGFGASRIVLYPLDGPAQRFWMARGFHLVTRSASTLVVEGPAQVRRLIDACQADPSGSGELRCGVRRPGREQVGRPSRA